MKQSAEIWNLLRKNKHILSITQTHFVDFNFDIQKNKQLEIGAQKKCTLQMLIMNKSYHLTSFALFFVTHSDMLLQRNKIGLNHIYFIFHYTSYTMK